VGLRLRPFSTKLYALSPPRPGAFVAREDEVRLTTNYYELLVDWPWLICYGSLD
jgi:hypothetical protein